MDLLGCGGADTTCGGKALYCGGKGWVFSTGLTAVTGERCVTAILHY